jgi:hypothetical protein
MSRLKNLIIQMMKNRLGILLNRFFYASIHKIFKLFIIIVYRNASLFLAEHNYVTSLPV